MYICGTVSLWVGGFKRALTFTLTYPAYTKCEKFELLEELRTKKLLCVCWKKFATTFSMICYQILVVHCTMCNIVCCCFIYSHFLSLRILSGYVTSFKEIWLNNTKKVVHPYYKQYTDNIQMNKTEKKDYNSSDIHN